MELSDRQLERYARHIILKDVGGEGQKRLLRARVLVIGAGGLGSPVILYLAAAGVGNIGIVDDDRVSLSNLQRQIIHDSAHLDTAKTDSAAERVRALNPDIDLSLHETRLDDRNAAGLIGDYDVIADGSDNFATRLAVNRACVEQGKTLVSAAVSPFEGQIASFTPGRPLPDGRPSPCYACFVGTDPQQSTLGTCSDEGILGAVTGVVGTLQAMEILKQILGIGESLAGHILLYDALSARFRRIRLKRDAACPVCGGGDQS